MSDAVYRCRSCKTRVSMGMPICPICGEPITPQTALLNAGSGAPVKVVTRHNSAASTVAEMPAQTEPEPVPQPQPTLQQMWDEMATPKTPDAVASMAHPYPAPPAKARAASRAFAVYVACVVMVLVGSFLIGIGLARRYTASEQAAQNSATPAKVIVVQAPAGVGGPLLTEVGEKAK
jgi:hypothetical protein